MDAVTRQPTPSTALQQNHAQAVANPATRMVPLEHDRRDSDKRLA
jgi:hypothetical protein